ncbi:MAG TPA: capsid cement protein, partial [Caulobacteraceae bacterium]
DFRDDGVGEYRFCKVNPNSVTGVGPSNPGKWYGGAQGQITVDPGNVVLCGAGQNALGVIVGKAALGQPIEVQIGNRALVVCGGTVTAGDQVASDANAAAITQTSTNHILGTALDSGVAGDLISITFSPRGEA